MTEVDERRGLQMSVEEQIKINVQSVNLFRQKK
jgi:hypothetical protein